MNIAKTCLAASILCLLPCAAWAGDGVATLKELAGAAHITHVAAKSPRQDMKLGDPVFEHDVVETEEGARAVFHFADDGELVITGTGKLVVDDYIYDAAKKDGNKASFSVLDAAFSYFGGVMDKGDKPAVTLNMNYGAIGVRGTKVWAALRNGLDWVYVGEGAVSVSNKGGEVILAPATGTRISSDTQTPAAPYIWGEAETGWIKRLVDDPASHVTPAMASNISLKDLKAPEDASEPVSPGGGASGSMRRDEDSAAPAAAPEQSAPAAAPPPMRAREAQSNERQLDRLAPAEAGKKEKTVVAGFELYNDAAGILRVDVHGAGVVPLLESPSVKAGETIIKYSAAMKALDFAGTAYLRATLHFPGKDGGATTTHSAMLAKAGDWQQYATAPFGLKSGQMPDKVTLELVVEGYGSLLVKDAKAGN